MEPAICPVPVARRLTHACAGALYFVDTCLGFHVGFLGKHNMAKKLVMDGRAIAWYYTARGNFPVDLITVIAWYAQVRRSEHELGV